MTWRGRGLTEAQLVALDLIGRQAWKVALKDKQRRQYRILLLEECSREVEHKIMSALDLLVISHTQKPMSPYRGATKAEYVATLKVASWRSIDNIVRKVKNPGTTIFEMQDVVNESANLTRFEGVFRDQDDFLAFQKLFTNEDIKDHINGGLTLDLCIDNTTMEGVQEILKRSGLNMKMIEFDDLGNGQRIFIPNQSFPENARKITLYEADDDKTLIAQ
ncbi:MAG: hypothetical protein KUG79_11550 [Pseudomonadales bacterium]|nr:hypothetical protein [Pseudomonadales bacterium]